MTLEFKAFAKMPRLSDEYMYISEKIDGTNAQVFIYDDFVNVALGVVEASAQMMIGSRSRYITPGKETDNYGFAAWCEEHREELLKLPPGRHYGEWWGNGIQRGYGVTTKYLSLFNQSLHEIKAIIPCIDFVPVLYEGPFDLHKIEEVMAKLKHDGSTAAPGFMEPEGVVVYLKKANLMFKKTFDDNHKGQKAS